MKRFISIFLCFILLLPAGAAYAEEHDSIQIFGAEQVEDTVNVLLYAKSNDTPKTEEITLECGEKTFAPDSINPYKGSSYGTSWAVIVEPTAYNIVNSMVSTTIEKLMASLPENDVVCICNAGTLELSDFSSSFKDLSHSIDKALSTTGQIKIFDSIKKSMDALNDSRNLSKRKCLLIISESVDTGSEATLSDVCEAAKGMPLTTYYMGITRGEQTLTNNYESMQTFVNATDSGASLSFTNIADPENPDKIVGEIQKNEDRCHILSFASGNLPAGKNGEPTEVLLCYVKNNIESKELFTVQSDSQPASNSNSKSDSDSDSDTSTHNHVWTEATCTEPKTCSLCGETEGSALGHDYSESGFFTSGVCSRCGDKQLSTVAKAWDWVKNHAVVSVIIGVVVLALVALPIVRTRRKKKEDDEGGTDDSGFADDKTVSVKDTGGKTERVKEVKTFEGKDTRTVPLKKVTVMLTNVQTGQTFIGEITDKILVAGRDSKLKLTGDASISGKQMSFIWDSGILYLQDERSLNGTRINNKPIKTATQLQQNDVIRVGQTDFRVTWQTNS